MKKYMPVKVISGENCLTSEGVEVFRNAGKKCLIVCGKSGAVKSGALGDCVTALNYAGVGFEIFDEITENPFTSTCLKAGHLAADIKADFIVGIGGGSALDASKAVAIYAANPSMTHDGIYAREGFNSPLPVYLIGTTAGTGSEVTGVSVLTNSDTERKKSISGKDCYAVVAFCDYRYTKSAPAKVTQSTALDAFAHAAESILCSNADDESTEYSFKAIELLKDFILSSCSCASLSETDYKKLYEGSLYAGLAINVTGTAFPHTLGYYLTEEEGTPHGIACIAFMPSLLSRAFEFAPEKLLLLEKAMGCGSKTLISAISPFIPTGIVTSPEQAAEIAERWSAGVKNFDRSPGGLTAEEAADILASL